MAGVPQPFKNISATTAPFVLEAGLYGFDYKATWSSGSVGLEKLAADGATYLPALATWTADGCVSGWLPRGTYRLKLTTASALYVAIGLITRG